jgi:hypothetical protein
MHNQFSRSLLGPRAIQNARTRIFVPGSDPRFASAARAADPRRDHRLPVTPTAALPTQRLFSSGLLDRLHAPLTRYAD